uniref:AlNc14C177G8144 protein n=2 Tax=Albugo laibachii Nc14 TaxID=890382 RepID=F0WNZ0_9STRA|nr:AlNc14C177G8144 [Albugo laibachii Nc14]|eukprot:CCA23033.1 AlNc14C177G8144 [Albugo laibachii Nc14]
MMHLLIWGITPQLLWHLKSRRTSNVTRSLWRWISFWKCFVLTPGQARSSFCTIVFGCSSSHDQAKTLYEAVLHSYNERVKISHEYNQESMFDYHMKNMEQWSRHFFRPVDSTCPLAPL